MVTVPRCGCPNENVSHVGCVASACLRSHHLSVGHKSPRCGRILMLAQGDIESRRYSHVGLYYFRWAYRRAGTGARAPNCNRNRRRPIHISHSGIRTEQPDRHFVPHHCAISVYLYSVIFSRTVIVSAIVSRCRCQTRGRVGTSAKRQPTLLQQRASST